MHMLGAGRLLLLVLLLPGSAVGTNPDGTSPPEVIARLVAHASSKPPGPVEDDVTEQSVKGAAAAQQFFDTDDKGPKKSVDDLIADEYDTFAIEGPMTTVYSDGLAAVFSGKVKMTAAALADEKADEKDMPAGQEMSIGFGDVGGGAMFVGPKVRNDGQVIATFCLIKQKGAWKVHCAYLSDDPLKVSDLNFVVKQLTAFAKKL